MPITIGPSFADELAAAGISGEGIAWGDDGAVEFRDDVPQATRDAVAAVLAAHNPDPPTFYGRPVWDRKTLYEAARKQIEEEFPVATQLRRALDAARAQADGAPLDPQFTAMHDRILAIRQEVADLIMAQGW